jgi:demethylmenaquinone methyltransferase/2-methoxy-6-polyprenyl-1,4-benzoquinol methylase
MTQDKTHFGYREVDAAEKAKLVDGVFTSVASKYDVMNDLMSMGVHRLWKRHFVATSGVRPGDTVLDLAGGTGDISVQMARAVGPKGLVLLTDFNAAMLREGRDRLLDEGVVDNVACTQVDAQAIPLADNRVDLVTIAFGLRNVTDKDAALREMHRVLKPGGRALVLEFSQVTVAPLRPLYDLYSFQVLPRLGAMVARDSSSYQYLAESIRKHPDQETLKGMMSAAGFANCSYRNLSAGIVAIHSGFKA